MSKPSLNPFQVWTKKVHGGRKFAVVVEYLGAYMSHTGGGSDVARVMVLEVGLSWKWSRATWRNGAPGGWELHRP